MLEALAAWLGKSEGSAAPERPAAPPAPATAVDQLGVWLAKSCAAPPPPSPRGKTMPKRDIIDEKRTAKGDASEDADDEDEGVARLGAWLDKGQRRKRLRKDDPAAPSPAPSSIGTRGVGSSTTSSPAANTISSFFRKR